MTSVSTIRRMAGVPNVLKEKGIVTLLYIIRQALLQFV